MNNIFPPKPPIKKEEFIPGKFDYIESKGDKIMFKSAYDAITFTETWDHVKNLSSFSSHEINTISNKIIELGYDGHSGCSFMATMREMQFIAKYGEKKFKERHDEYIEKTKNNRELIDRGQIIHRLTNPSLYL
jgi:hypothetical protein